MYKMYKIVGARVGHPQFYTSYTFYYSVVLSNNYTFKNIQKCKL